MLNKLSRRGDTGGGNENAKETARSDRLDCGHRSITNETRARAGVTSTTACAGCLARTRDRDRERRAGSRVRLLSWKFKLEHNRAAGQPWEIKSRQGNEASALQMYDKILLFDRLQGL